MNKNVFDHSRVEPNGPPQEVVARLKEAGERFYDTSQLDPKVTPLDDSMRLRAGRALDTIRAGAGAVIDAVENERSNFQVAVEVLKAMREARDDWIDGKLTEHYAKAQKFIKSVADDLNLLAKSKSFDSIEKPFDVIEWYIGLASVAMELGEDAQAADYVDEAFWVAADHRIHECPEQGGPAMKLLDDFVSPRRQRLAVAGFCF